MLLLGETAREYAAFMALIGALFVISGGIYLGGSLAGAPAGNTALLAVGALLASVVGTTGASALLIRPLLRANARRAHARHIVILFIFIVANGGGMLTPLGDPIDACYNFALLVTCFRCINTVYHHFIYILGYF